MIRYALPDFSGAFQRNLYFAKLLRTCPELFRKNVTIDSVYGCFPGCIANGGRAYLGERTSRSKMEEVFDSFNELGVVVRLTFTNMLLEERHLEDGYLNEILDASVGRDVEVIVHSDLMADYVRERLGCKVVLSTTRPLMDAGSINAALEDYDYVVLNYELNKRADVLELIESRGRLEVMVNELCRPGCPFRQEHYRVNSQDQLDGVHSGFRKCDLSDSDFCLHKPGSPTTFTAQEVSEFHERFGVQYFKIVGRGVNPFVTIDAYLHYLIEDGHRSYVARAFGVS